ncbi:hypothetical protein ACQKHR_11800, partial [Escherichia coli]
QYHDEEIERVHKPLLRMLAALQTVSPSITCNATLYDALKAMKFADFAVWSEARFSGMVKTALTLAVTTTLKELTP